MFGLFKKKKSTKATVNAAKTEETLFSWLDDSIGYGDETQAKMSRDEIKKSRTTDLDYNAFITDFVKGVAGANIVFQSNIKGEKTFNDEIESWWEFCDKKGNCDTSRNYHMNGFIRQMATQWISDGGFIVRTHYNEQWDSYLRFELISVDRIDTTKGVRGLEFDAWGGYTKVYIKDFNNKTNAISIDELIVFIPSWIDVYQRGAVSKLSALKAALDRIEQYVDAEVKQATNRARNGVFWFSSIFSTLIDSMREAHAKDADEGAGFRKFLTSARKKIQASAYKGDGITPMPHGDEVKFDHQTPSSTFKELTSFSKGLMAASIGKASSLVYFDIGDANYSSLKAALQSSEITSSIDFDDLFNMVLQGMKELQIEAGVAMGELDLPNYNQQKRKYHKVTARRTNKIDIEPVKTATANEKNANANHVSRKDIANEYGKDAEQVIDDNLELELYEKKRRAELKIEKEVSV